jgi:uncharacterized surface protein with fasciclin (FAS1) repeats
MKVVAFLTILTTLLALLLQAGEARKLRAKGGTRSSSSIATPAEDEAYYPPQDLGHRKLCSDGKAGKAGRTVNADAEADATRSGGKAGGKAGKAGGSKGGRVLKSGKGGKGSKGSSSESDQMMGPAISKADEEDCDEYDEEDLDGRDDEDEDPDADAPTPASPTPADSTPDMPTPADPTPSSPTPADPTPGSPTPADPTPGSPTPADPAPTPASPTPASPTQGSPTPVTPDVGDGPVEDRTVWDVTTTTPECETLVVAATVAGVVDALELSGPMTLFCPQTIAFEALAQDDPELVNTLFTYGGGSWNIHLVHILYYHIFFGSTVFSGDLVPGDITMLNGGTVDVAIEPIILTDEMVNERSPVPPLIDLEASNGVAHVIDGVSSQMQRSTASFRFSLPPLTVVLIVVFESCFAPTGPHARLDWYYHY